MLVKCTKIRFKTYPTINKLLVKYTQILLGRGKKNRKTEINTWNRLRKALAIVHFSKKLRCINVNKFTFKEILKVLLHNYR